MTIQNLTPHDVIVECPDGTRHAFPASGLVARVDVRTVPDEDEDGIGVPVVGCCYGDARIPESAGQGPYIVSTLFADAYRRQGGAARLYTPDSGPAAIREGGQIVAVRALIRR